LTVIGRDGSIAFTVRVGRRRPRLRVVESPESSAGRRGTPNGWYLRIAANTSVVVENQKNDSWAPELRTASCCESKNHSGWTWTSLIGNPE
jgi:hypothetical protein